MTLIERLERRFHSNAMPFAADTPPKIEVVAVSSVPPPVNPDGPEAAALINEMSDLLFDSLYHLRRDDAAKAYHEKVVALRAKVQPPTQPGASQ